MQNGHGKAIIFILPFFKFHKCSASLSENIMFCLSHIMSVTLSLDLALLDGLFMSRVKHSPKDEAFLLLLLTLCFLLLEGLGESALSINGQQQGTLVILFRCVFEQT